jgi:hypothetical protein
MASFERDGACPTCGCQFVVSGTALFPGAETEAEVPLACACGGEIAAWLPASANRERLEVRPRKR